MLFHPAIARVVPRSMILRRKNFPHREMWGGRKPALRRRLAGWAGRLSAGLPSVGRRWPPVRASRGVAATRAAAAGRRDAGRRHGCRPACRSSRRHCRRRSCGRCRHRCRHNRRPACRPKRRPPLPPPGRPRPAPCGGAPRGSKPSITLTGSGAREALDALERALLQRGARLTAVPNARPVRPIRCSSLHEAHCRAERPARPVRPIRCTWCNSLPCRCRPGMSMPRAA